MILLKVLLIFKCVTEKALKNYYLKKNYYFNAALHLKSVLIRGHKHTIVLIDNHHCQVLPAVLNT